MSTFRYEIRIPEGNAPRTVVAQPAVAALGSGNATAPSEQPSSQNRAAGAQTTNNPLRALRRQSYMTQQDVAQCLGVSQRRVSEIERADIDSLRVSTLQRYINAIGGNLRVIVVVEK